MTLSGYKSIQSLKRFRLEPINLLIGPNGSGKSNLISFFRMLSWMLTEQGQLQEPTARSGGASRLLHLGSQKTQTMEGSIRFATTEGTNDYEFRLAYASGDTFVFTEERFRFSRQTFGTEAPWRHLDVGHRESRLFEAASQGDRTANFLLGAVRRIKSHQFHNTSETARPRGKWSIDDGRWLKSESPFSRHAECTL